MSEPQNFPMVGGAWIDARGNPTQAFLAFCRALWNRTGQGSGVSADDLAVLTLLAQGQSRPDVEARRRADDALLLALATRGARAQPSVQTGVQAAIPSEALAAGDLTNTFLSSGAMHVQKATASDPTKFANGFVLTAAAIGVPVVIYPTGAFNSAAAVATGQSEVWLSDTTPGAFSLTAPSTTGHIVQTVGAAYQGAGLAFVQGDYIIL